jgi:hypothetical protein
MAVSENETTEKVSIAGVLVNDKTEKM